LHAPRSDDVAGRTSHPRTSRIRDTALQAVERLTQRGRVERRDRVARNVRSLAMRATPLGFQFNFEDDVLLRMCPEPYKGGGWSSVA